MLTIRLARAGRTKYPTYRIVAAESARAATGKFIAVLGHYNPHTKELVMKREAIQTHLSHGAQPSNTVIKLLQREKVELPKWVVLKTKQSKPKNAPEVEDNAEAPKASAGEPKAAEAPKASATQDSVDKADAASDPSSAPDNAEPTDAK